ncbi:hypothetical protein AAY473_036423 [Plecturocebus cupreus]
MVVHACSPSYSEMEMGGSLKPNRLTLQGSMIMPLHSSLDDRARLYQKKK